MKIKINREFPVIKGSTVKYPNQVFASIKQARNVKTTFSVDAHMVAVEDGDGITPSELHKAGLSRFVLSILRIESDTKTVTGNIPVAEVAGFLQEADFSLNYLSFLKTQSTPQTTGTTQTKTVTLKFGPHKGKTPEEVLLENPANRESLENSKKLLVDKVAQYPANQELIDAIDNAIALLESGKLAPSNSTVATATKAFPVYESGIKVPNSSKVNEHGKTMVYTINITCDPNMNIPYQVEIMNGYCLVPKDGEVNFSSMEGSVKLNTRLTKMQFASLVANIKRRLNLFEIINAEKSEFLENTHSYHKRDLTKTFEIDEAFMDALAARIASLINK